MTNLVDSGKLIFSLEKFIFWESIWLESYLTFIFDKELVVILSGLSKQL